MKRFGVPFFALLAMSLPGSIAGAAETNKTVLSAYENVSVALANDDLTTAKSGADALAKIAKATGNEAVAEHASAVAKSDSLYTAGEELKGLSEEAVKLTQKTEGYHVMKCVMNGAFWVQPRERAINPYMGKQMQECGMIIDQTKSFQ